MIIITLLILIGAVFFALLKDTKDELTVPRSYLNDLRSKPKSTNF
ncbi:hypothetical protein [Jiulongibacter sp. NS-SX5]